MGKHLMMLGIVLGKCTISGNFKIFFLLNLLVQFG